MTPASVAPVTCASAGPIPILEDAVTNASLFVSNNQPIASLDVALLVNHPRVSDMVFTLISPSGTRVLLFENRGGATTNGLGGIVLRTNIFPTTNRGRLQSPIRTSCTSALTRAPCSLTMTCTPSPDTMHVYYDNVLIYDSGLVSFTNHVAIPFGPGVSTNIVIIMNEGNNSDTNTLWEYTATVACPVPAYLVFTENTNLAPVPIKFASPPFLPAGTNLDLYCLPEQSLNTLVGENAYGTWQLEMWDTRAGAACSRARAGRLAVALRLPEHRARAHRLEPRGHCHQHHSARPGRPLCR